MSEADLLLRERLGRFPFDLEDKVLIQRFKAFFSSFILPDAFQEDQFKVQIGDFQSLDGLGALFLLRRRASRKPPIGRLAFPGVFQSVYPSGRYSLLRRRMRTRKGNFSEL